MESCVELASEFETESSVATDLSARIVRFYRGWHTYEKANGGPSIIDFDLSSLVGEETFQSRRQIAWSLAQLRDELTGSSWEETFLRARLNGSVAYLDALRKREMAFPEYVRQTLGTDPESIAEPELAEMRLRIESLLAPYDLHLQHSDLARYKKLFSLEDPEAIRQGIIGDQDQWLLRVREAGIPVPSKLPLTVKFANVDEYWSNWIDGSYRDGITLAINLHKRKQYTKDAPLFLCLHEICGHAVQMSIWQNRIAEGQLSQACGLTNVHSPEMFVVEGLGQTVPDLLSDDVTFSNDFKLGRALSYYNLSILHNAHLKLYEGVPVEEVFEYACDNLPFADPTSLKSELRDRRTSPLFRTYLLSYVQGERTIKGLIRDFSVPAKRELFNKMYRFPMTPQQLMATASDIASKYR